LCGSFTCRITAVAAAASGGATIAPSAIATGHGISGTSQRERNRQHGRADRGDHEPGHRSPVRSQVAQRGVVGRVHQHRRDEERQRELRIERPVRARGDEREQRPAEREQGRIRRADPARQRGKQGCAEQQHDDPFERGHGGVLPFSLCRFD